MKNLLKHGLVLAILFVSSVAFADEANISMKAKENTQKSIVFYLDQAQKVNLSIYSLNDGLIYEQNIVSDKPLTKVYNLEAFPDGSYIVKLENAAKLIEYQVNISKGKTLVAEPVVTEYFKPVLVKNSDTVTLDLKNVPHGPIEIKIFNEYNEELFAKSFASKLIAAKKFNIGQTNAKELTFIVRSKNEEFIETVSVK